MDKIEELLTRGVDHIYPTKKDLEKILRSGKKLRLYQGFDPTGSQLHIGHMVGLKKMRQWQDLGHKVIFLIGDFTGTVGDPSGKTTARKVLSHEEVLENAKTYKEQAAKILRFEGENPVEIKFNGDWLNKMSMLDFIKIQRLVSVNQVLERDLFQERLKNNEDIYMNEFYYPLMQAYDCVVLDVDLEIGGTDQMFNMMLGRKLMRHMQHKDKFVITTPLLTDAQGRKIGKTEGNVIALKDDPKELYGKILAIPDNIILKGFEYLTDIPLDEIKKIEKNIANGENPIIYKKQLAFEITKDLNDLEAAQNAAENFEKTVQKNEIPDEIPEFEISKNETSNVLDVLVNSNLATSKNEVKRLIEQGGVSLNGEKVTDPDLQVKEGILKVGKHKFLKICNKL